MRIYRRTPRTNKLLAKEHSGSGVSNGVAVLRARSDDMKDEFSVLLDRQELVSALAIVDHGVIAVYEDRSILDRYAPESGDKVEAMLKAMHAAAQDDSAKDAIRVALGQVGIGAAETLGAATPLERIEIAREYVYGGETATSLDLDALAAVENAIRLVA